MTAPSPFTLHPGTAPLLISFPHVGTHVPPALAARLTPKAREVHDTDWHLPRLYDFARALGASLLIATHSRYVIDLNRPPDGASLYPGQSVTALCPVDDFDGESIHLDVADEPGAQEIAERRAAIWQPYHDALAAELARIKAAHGVAVLWDAHSIRSVLPRFFDGKLPDLNLGTAESAPGFTAVLNGRFKGGHITRAHGRPQDGVHAVQLEMTQSSYMQEAMPFDYLPEQAARIQPTLERLLQTALAFAQRA